MRFPHIWHFAYFSKVRLSHIFSAYFGISAALNILCSNFSLAVAGGTSKDCQQPIATPDRTNDLIQNSSVEKYHIICSRTRWLIQASRICRSAMDLLQRQQQARFRDDSRRKKNASGKRSRKNWRYRKVRKNSGEHPPCRRLVESRTSAPRSSGQMLGWKS